MLTCAKIQLGKRICKNNSPSSSRAEVKKKEQPNRVCWKNHAPIARRRRRAGKRSNERRNNGKGRQLHLEVRVVDIVPAIQKEPSNVLVRGSGELNGIWDTPRLSRSVVAHPAEKRAANITAASDRINNLPTFMLSSFFPAVHAGQGVFESFPYSTVLTFSHSPPSVL